MHFTPALGVGILSMFILAVTIAGKRYRALPLRTL
jgi:hypothetical protein